MCAGTHVAVSVNVENRGQSWVLSFIPLHLIFETGSLTEVGFVSSTRMDSQWATRRFACLCCPTAERRYAALLLLGAGNLTQVIMLLQEGNYQLPSPQTHIIFGIRRNVHCRENLLYHLSIKTKENKQKKNSGHWTEAGNRRWGTGRKRGFWERRCWERH